MSAASPVVASHGLQVEAGTPAPVNDKELVWRLYEDNRKQAQFHEMQRATGTGLIMGGAGALITAITHDHKISLSDLPLAMMLIVLGVFGYFFSLKSYERMRLHLRRCDVFLQMMDGFDSSLNLIEIKAKCDAEHRRAFFLSSRLHLRSFWQGVHVLVFLAGVGFTYAIVETSRDATLLLRLLRLGGN